MTNDVNYGGAVVAALPLALLEATRSHDRPSEVLQDEDLAISLPRRLGLSGVVDTQIRRFQTAARSGKRVPLDDFSNLLKLVLRRPDAEAILRETGARVARAQFDKVPPTWLSLVRLMPRAVRYAAIRRAARRLLRNIAGSDTVTVQGSPVHARIKNPATALLEPAGMACALYGAAFEELASLYLGRKANVVHARCAVRGGDSCEWRLES
jgi:predicted hydrocarbon binding protein